MLLVKSHKLFLETMALRLKLDPRPPLYDSVAEAVISADEGVIEDAVEHEEWRPLRPAPISRPDLAFIDGVERREKRLSAEGEGRFVPGMLASFAAGTVWPGKAKGACAAQVQRRLITGAGITAPALTLRSSTAAMTYTPVSSPETDFEGLGKTLNQLRADLEARLVHQLQGEGAGVIIVDGRLPPDAEAPAVGLIKDAAHPTLGGQQALRGAGGDRGRRALARIHPQAVGPALLLLVRGPADAGPGRRRALRPGVAGDVRLDTADRSR